MDTSKTVTKGSEFKWIQFININRNTGSYDDTWDNEKASRWYEKVYENETIVERFRTIQEDIINREVPILTKLLCENTFEDGFQSLAEKYYDDLSKKYGVIADTVLQNVYLRNLYNNQYLLKHLLFIISNISDDRRYNLEIVPLAGLANPDIEIQDLSVRCFEAWLDRKHLPTLRTKRQETTVEWFREYLDMVILELEGV